MNKIKFLLGTVFGTVSFISLLHATDSTMEDIISDDDYNFYLTEEYNQFSEDDEDTPQNSSSSSQSQHSNSLEFSAILEEIVKDNSIIVANRSLEEFGHAWVEKLMAYLQKNKLWETIKEISILGHVSTAKGWKQSNIMKPGGLIELLDNLPKFSNLQKLHLVGVGVKDCNLFQIKELVEKGWTPLLTDINFDDNRISWEGSKVLLSLFGRTTLNNSFHLSLRGNDISRIDLGIVESCLYSRSVEINLDRNEFLSEIPNLEALKNLHSTIQSMKNHVILTPSLEDIYNIQKRLSGQEETTLPSVQKTPTPSSPVSTFSGTYSAPIKPYYTPTPLVNQSQPFDFSNKQEPMSKEPNPLLVTEIRAELKKHQELSAADSKRKKNDCPLHEKHIKCFLSLVDIAPQEVLQEEWKQAAMSCFILKSESYGDTETDLLLRKFYRLNDKV